MSVRVFVPTFSLCSHRISAQVFTHLVIGWPLYLLGLASTGKLGHDGNPLSSIADHYRPWSAMFPAKMWNKVALSTFGVVALLAVLLKLSLVYG